MGKDYYSMYGKEKKTENTVEKPVVEKKAPVEKKATVREEKRATAKKAQVVDCVCLNIRATPDMHAKILSTANAGMEIMVDENGSNDIWCSVKLPNGQEGHAMRKFLKIL